MPKASETPCTVRQSRESAPCRTASVGTSASTPMRAAAVFPLWQPVDAAQLEEKWLLQLDDSSLRAIWNAHAAVRQP
eukprot:6867851-Prymnesium_polylepis.1